MMYIVYDNIQNKIWQKFVQSAEKGLGFSESEKNLEENTTRQQKRENIQISNGSESQKM